MKYRKIGLLLFVTGTLSICTYLLLVLTKHTPPIMALTNPITHSIGDILVFDGHAFNPYGHVAIISAVSNENIEIIQQNPGPTAPSRELLSLTKIGNQYEIEDGLGWLGKR